MTFCMNVSRFMNLAAIFSLDLESQSTRPTRLTRPRTFWGFTYMHLLAFVVVTIKWIIRPKTKKNLFS